MSGCIVCGIDDTEHGLTVARMAARLSRSLDLRVVLVHVARAWLSTLPPATAALPSTLAPEQAPPVEMHVRAESVAETAHSLLVRTAEVELLVGAELRAERGDPAERILAVAKQEDAELVVVGSRRRGSLATMFLGSVSQAVVNRAACPVVVVPDGVHVPAPWALEAMRVS